MLERERERERQRERERERASWSPVLRETFALIRMALRLSTSFPSFPHLERERERERETLQQSPVLSENMCLHSHRSEITLFIGVAKIFFRLRKLGREQMISF